MIKTKLAQKIKLAAILCLGVFWLYAFPVNAADSSERAVEGVISGDVQKVGFRAFIFRQAIQYNLGGVIENLPNGTVHFMLQGESPLLEKALVVIRQGPAKSSVKGIEVKNVAVQKNLPSVTVKGWTSVTRDFHQPVDLIYVLRKNRQPITEAEMRRIYQGIIRKAMSLGQTSSAEKR